MSRPPQLARCSIFGTLRKRPSASLVLGRLAPTKFPHNFNLCAQPQIATFGASTHNITKEHLQNLTCQSPPNSRLNRLSLLFDPLKKSYVAQSLVHWGFCANSVSQTKSIKMKHLAAYLLLGLGGNSEPSASDIKGVLSSVGVDADDERLEKLVEELKGKEISEVWIDTFNARGRLDSDSICS